MTELRCLALTSIRHPGASLKVSVAMAIGLIAGLLPFTMAWSDGPVEPPPYNFSLIEYCVGSFSSGPCTVVARSTTGAAISASGAASTSGESITYTASSASIPGQLGGSASLTSNTLNSAGPGIMVDALEQLVDVVTISFDGFNGANGFIRLLFTLHGSNSATGTDAQATFGPHKVPYACVKLRINNPIFPFGCTAYDQPLVQGTFGGQFLQFIYGQPFPLWFQLESIAGTGFGPGRLTGLGSSAANFQNTATIARLVVFDANMHPLNGTPNITSAQGVSYVTGAPIAAWGQTIVTTEGAAFSGAVATFSDPDTAATSDEYAARIDWGDSSPTSAGTITGSAGLFTVNGSHVYKEEGTYSPTVTITEVDNASNKATATSTATVSEPAVVATGTPISATEGAAFTGKSVATFTDPGGAEPNPSDPTAGIASHYTAAIDWGDATPSSAGTITYSDAPGSTTAPFLVAGSHTYAEEGTHTVTTKINHEGVVTTATSTATVADAALAAKCAAPAVSSVAFSGNVATFIDAASPSGTLSDFSATINWGDNTASGGTVSGPNGGPYTVSGSHTYNSTGTFTVKTTVNDVGGSSTSTDNLCRVLIFAFAPGGNFVIGDQDSILGTHVEFWGAQWSKLNDLTGGSAPASFKGFEDTPQVTTCGTAWITHPGNSAPPPTASLHAYIGVVVSSSITKTGERVSGNAVNIVVVKTNPGYDPTAPDPGHAGTGTVVAKVC